MAEYGNYFKQLLATFRDIPSGDLEAIGAFITMMIKERTRQEGKDVNGQDFQSYTESYQKVRQSLGLQTNYVDLTRQSSDSMLDTLTPAVSTNQIEIQATSPIAGYVNEGTTNMPKREFLGLTDEEVDQIEEMIASSIEMALMRD